MNKVFAPAKVNLTLHVTGQRNDDYHLLDSLVAFADIGDSISISPDDQLSLEITGPMSADVPQDSSNLLLRAAALFDTHRGAALGLDKQLPVAAGIGGGSSDAAATLKGLSRFWQLPLPADQAIQNLGADIPVCMEAQYTRMQGVGEELSVCTGLPNLPAVLVNPGISAATPEVFKALLKRQNAPMPDQMPNFKTVGECAHWLTTQRNDLEPPACALHPVINEVLGALNVNENCFLSRMSGSGATCFGIYPDIANARTAANRLAKSHKNWWIAPTILS